jgi:hypothetical protein
MMKTPLTTTTMNRPEAITQSSGRTLALFFILRFGARRRVNAVNTVDRTATPVNI